MSDDKPIGDAKWLRTYKVYESLEDGSIVPMKDAYPKCDHNTCDQESTYYYRHMCCNTVSMACTLHTNGFMRFLVDLDQRGGMAKCAFCGRYKPPLMLIVKPQPLRLDKTA